MFKFRFQFRVLENIQLFLHLHYGDFLLLLFFAFGSFHLPQTVLKDSHNPPKIPSLPPHQYTRQALPPRSRRSGGKRIPRRSSSERLAALSSRDLFKIAWIHKCVRGSGSQQWSQWSTERWSKGGQRLWGLPRPLVARAYSTFLAAALKNLHLVCVFNLLVPAPGISCQMASFFFSVSFLNQHMNDMTNETLVNQCSPSLSLSTRACELSHFPTLWGSPARLRLPAFSSSPSAIRQPLPNFIPSTSRRRRLGNNREIGWCWWISLQILIRA